MKPINAQMARILHARSEDIQAVSRLVEKTTEKITKKKGK